MIFTLRQVQEKCREQNCPLSIAFVDLTKAFDTVSRPALYTVLRNIGCPPKLLSLITSFHEEMTGCIQFDGNILEKFGIKNGVKQGCVLAPILFSIYFATLLHHSLEGKHWRHLHSDKNGWLSVQPSQTSSKDENSGSPPAWAPICRWCSYHRPWQKITPEHDESTGLHLRTLLFNHQCEEDRNCRTRNTYTSKHLPEWR